MAVVSSDRKKSLQIKQSHKLAQGQSAPSLTQAKGYKYLLYKALPELKAGSIHQCPVSELRNVLGFHDSKELQASMEALTTVQIDWDSLGNSNVLWGKSALLASCLLQTDGQFSYAFDPQMVSELLKPTRYRWLNMELLLGFQSLYALKIYEAASHYYDAKKKWGRTPNMTREKLREWLNVPVDSYKQHRDFFRRAIHEPLREVNERGELVVSFHDDRGKPRVRQYWFEARVNPQHDFPFSPGDNHPQPLALSVTIPSEPLKEITLTGLADQIGKNLKVERSNQPSPGTQSELFK